MNYFPAAIGETLLLGAALVLLFVIVGLFFVLAVGLFEDANRNDFWYDKKGRHDDRAHR